MEVLVFAYFLVMAFSALLSIIVKPATGMLHCGIFGWQGVANLKESKVREAMLKVKILGLYNESRGRDSCGIAIGDHIIKGIDKERLWNDFIADNYLPLPDKDNTVIGHTRSSTRGAHTSGNAHPFLINKNLVGVHNGVISNIDTLLRKYEKNPSDFNVDSQGFYQLIGDEGFKVLEEYTGYAALAFRYLDDANTLYLYHGASRNYTAGDIIEERPLFVMKADDGLYFSSISTALRAIQESDEHKILTLNYNTVIQIKNGNWTDYRFHVKRDDKNIITSSVGKYTPASDNQSSKSHKRSTNQSSHSRKGAAAMPHVDPVILRETLPAKICTTNPPDCVYYHQGRYWEMPRTLCHGRLHIHAKGIIDRGQTPMAGSEVSYFWRGVMLKDEEAFKKIENYHRIGGSEAWVNNTKLNFAACIAKYSKYPVTNMRDQAVGLQAAFRWAWFRDDGRASGSFTPKYSGRSYVIETGFLRDIVPSYKGEQCLHHEYHTAELEVDVFKKGGVLGTDAKGGASEEEGFHEGQVPGTSKSLHPTASKFLGGSEDSKSYNLKRNPELEGYGSDSPGRDRPISTDGEQDGGNDLKYFYEVTYKSMPEMLSALGSVERKALSALARHIIAKDLPLDPDDKEIEMGVCDILLTAVQSKSTIADLCVDQSEYMILVEAYQRALDDANEEYEKEEEERQNNEDRDQYVKEIDIMMEAIDNIEKRNAAPNADVETMLADTTQSLQEMLNRAQSLTEDEDLASQELASTLYKGVSNIQGNLVRLAEKYNYTALAKTIKALNRKEG